MGATQFTREIETRELHLDGRPQVRPSGSFGWIFAPQHELRLFFSCYFQDINRWSAPLE
jgi:hypothetical protein